MGSIVRAGAYAPRSNGGGRRCLGPDEDAFTLVATALERVAGSTVVPAGPLPVHLLGPSAPASGMGLILGTEVSVHAHPAGARSMLEALGAALAAPGPSVVVALDLTEDPHSLPYSEGSVAFLIAGAAVPGPSSEKLPAPSSGSEGGVELARRWYGLRSSADRETWVGDWALDRVPMRPRTDQRVGSPVAATASVSEGAYLPKASYLDGIPSRWRFAAERCSRCRRLNFPIRHRCRSCGRSDGLTPEPLPLDGGSVVATTWIGPGGQPTEFDPQVEATGSYGVALVDLTAEARVTLQLSDVGPGEIRLGDQVSTLLRRTYSQEGEWRYGRKAVPFASDLGGRARPA